MIDQLATNPPYGTLLYHAKSRASPHGSSSVDRDASPPPTPRRLRLPRRSHADRPDLASYLAYSHTGSVRGETRRVDCDLLTFGIQTSRSRRVSSSRRHSWESPALTVAQGRTAIQAAASIPSPVRAIRAQGVGPCVPTRGGIPWHAWRLGRRPSMCRVRTGVADLRIKGLGRRARPKPRFPITSSFP